MTDETPVDLEALRALEAAATPAPWAADTVVRGDCVVWGPDGKFIGNTQAEPHWVPNPDGSRRAAMFDVDRRDVELIAAVRNALPGLLDRVAAAEKLSFDNGFEAARLVPFEAKAAGWKRRAGKLEAERDQLTEQLTTAALHIQARDLGLVEQGKVVDRLTAELTQARQQLAAVTAERDRHKGYADDWFKKWQAVRDELGQCVDGFGHLMDIGDQLERRRALLADAIPAAPVPAPADEEWRHYTVEASPGDDAANVYVLCRSDDMCDKVRANDDDRYLTLGEAVDWAKAHVAKHAADTEADADQLCSDKNGFHDEHLWAPDPCDDLIWCPGYPVPVRTPAAAAPAVTVQADGPARQDGAA